MNDRFTVSTACPSCGAPLDFREGSTALQCGHCRSPLLVTGRKQVLSYAIPPTLTVQGAVAIMSAAHQQKGSPYRIVHSQLYFLPYYRLTGHDFLWEWVPPSGERLEGVQGDDEESRFRDWQRQRSFLRGDGVIQFRDRYIEKNFLACDLYGAGVYSLGVRPSVLRLRLFHRATLEVDGRLVSATLSPEVALVQGMKTDIHAILYRQILGCVLSVIYFPFWIVEAECQGKRHLTIIDAVAQTLVTAEASTALYPVLNRPPSADPPVIGFRPLSCPNCGWDLPVRPEDAIFLCSSCNRAWQIAGRELFEVSSQTVEKPQTGIRGPMRYLPLWVVQTGNAHKFQRFFVPAFRYRRLKLLSDLAMNMARRQPAYSLTNGVIPELQGCYYDQEDAVRLAQFVSVGLRAKNPEELSAMQDEQFPISSATLTWFPFSDQGYSLVEPFTKTSLLPHLLL
jgi:DNA-directed RNA polymerase subunit RPC12/RpoP